MSSGKNFEEEKKLRFHSHCFSRIETLIGGGILTVTGIYLKGFFHTESLAGVILSPVEIYLIYIILLLIAFFSYVLVFRFLLYSIEETEKDLKLAERGFQLIKNPLENLKKIPEQAGVYALSLRRKIERVKGITDILYIGETNDLRNRMKKYGGGWIKEEGTGHRICESLQRLRESVDLLFKLEENIEINKTVKEKKLLKEFLKVHHELPPLNRNGPKLLNSTVA